jgi:hypothetical protein
MTKNKKVVLKMSFEESSDVLMVLIDAQKGYAKGPTEPKRISNIREVLLNLDEAMENYIGSKIEE